MIYVLFPTETEAGPFIEGLDGLRAAHIAHRRSYTGLAAGRELSVIVCGVGQANAAQAVASALDTLGPGPVVLGGCAGAYPGSGLLVGDVAVADAETYADTGVDTPGGFMTLEDAGLPLLELHGSSLYGGMPLPYGEKLDLSIFSGLGFRVVSGGFLTVSTVSGTGARAAELYRRYGALCENMEGAAAAQVAALYDARMLEVRGVSNMVEDRDREAWDIPLASRNCASAVMRLLEVWNP